MLDKALVIILFMYGSSISFITVEFMFVDVFHIVITDLNGVPITGGIVSSNLQLDRFNAYSRDIINGTYQPTNGTFYNRVETSVTASAAIAWNFIQLLTGTYVFNLLLIFDVPWPFVTGMIILYMLLLARAIFGYINRV